MTRHLTLELLDANKLIKVNDLKEVTNPVFFVRDNIPTSDGLLSNDIFGITKDDRGSIFAYIDLSDMFMHPLCYKVWSKMDKQVKEIVHGSNNFIVNSKGEFEPSENGENGVKFIKKNIDKIKIKRTGSAERDQNIKFLMQNKDKMFINKMIIIPAYYRDINTDKGYVGVGEINKLYNSLLISIRGLKESKDYGLNMSNATRGRVQELLLQIYNWFGAGTTIDGAPTPALLPSKMGVIRRAGLRKTTDYANRLVLSAPNLLVENLDDIGTTLDYSMVPLSSICSDFFPFIVFNVRRFFENEFAGDGLYQYVAKDGTLKYAHLKDFQIEFSDERIKKEIDRFMFGYSNRFIPIEVPNKENIKLKMRFKGFNMTPEEFAKKEPGSVPILDRPLTWCDVLFIAACEAVKDRTILITRYPIDSMYNQFPTMVRVSSTKDTEPMVINNTFYKNYPKIRKEDIGSNTSNRFVDTMNMCNAYLSAIGGDYDGDQVTIKGIFSDEANQELKEYMNSKAHYINLGGENIRTNGNECIQSLYSLTLVLPDTKLKDPIF